MRIETLRGTRSCVASAKSLLIAILLFSIFVQTRQQQRDIESKWDKRLLPTNSVYEKSQMDPESKSDSEASSSLVSLSDENNVMENSKAIENSASYEDDNSEEIYDEDYERDEDDGSENVEEKKSESAATPIASASIDRVVRTESEKSSSAEHARGPETSHEDDYYYYEDYDNATNTREDASEPETVNDFDSSENAEMSLPSEQREKSLERSSSEDNSEQLETLLKEASSSEEVSPESWPIRSRTKDRSSDEGDEASSDSEEADTREKSAELGDDEILIGEAVVSVVTTKSVVNGTISVPMSSTSTPATIEQITPPMIPSSTPNPGMIEATTEDSRIVASVQTSRSISGARFLPFLVVEAIDKNTYTKNTDESHERKVESTDDTEGSAKNIGEKEKLGEALSTTTRKTYVASESTESIIDKLDRVQSELSSGFLANGFRTSGNTLPLDALSEQRPVQTRKSFATTSRTPVISKFVPRRYNQEKKTATQFTTTSGKFAGSGSPSDEENNATTEKAKFRWPSSSRNSRPSSTESSVSHHNSHKNDNLRGFGTNNAFIKTTTQSSIFGAGNQDISAFLPPGYKFKKEDERVTEKSLLSEILAKSKFDVSSLLPANYNGPREDDESREDVDEMRNGAKSDVNKNSAATFPKSSPSLPFTNAAGRNGYADTTEDNAKVTGTTERSSKPGKSLQDLFAKTSVDITALLPPDYNKFKNREKTEKPTTTRNTETPQEESTVPMTQATTPRSVGGIKLVFPSRPGGRKASAKVTTTPHRSEGSGPVTPKIQKGWPTRATTEFTGWPTPSTTPISIEKLLEAARTATVPSVNVSMVTMTQMSSTIATSTTTTTTPRPTTPGICEDECEVAGTIRIIGNATWVPELLDRNTKEWQQLAEEIEKEMNLVFAKSSVLKQWYKRVRIDAFSPGSILVDYFIELADLSQRINTQELKVIFHDSLRTYHSDVWNETRAKGPVKLGAFVLDPKSTDFVVIPKVTYPPQIQDDDRLIPQWAIAVIVIGVGGLLFIIVFGVSVLVNRQNASKLKPNPVVFTDEVAKNIMQASHGAASHRSSHDYPKSEISTIWNDTELWRDKSFESNSNEMAPPNGRKFSSITGEFNTLTARSRSGVALPGSESTVKRSVLVDGTLGRERSVDRRLGERKYNMYDSWRSEWNGYYYNPSQSSKFAGYESTTNLSRHPPDYDTNF